MLLYFHSQRPDVTDRLIASNQKERMTLSNMRIKGILDKLTVVEALLGVSGFEWELDECSDDSLLRELDGLIDSSKTGTPGNGEETKN